MILACSLQVLSKEIQQQKDVGPSICEAWVLQLRFGPYPSQCLVKVFMQCCEIWKSHLAAGNEGAQQGVGKEPTICRIAPVFLGVDDCC